MLKDVKVRCETVTTREAAAVIGAARVGKLRCEEEEAELVDRTVAIEGLCCSFADPAVKVEWPASHLEAAPEPEYSDEGPAC